MSCSEQVEAAAAQVRRCIVSAASPSFLAAAVSARREANAAIRLCEVLADVLLSQQKEMEALRLALDLQEGVLT